MHRAAKFGCGRLALLAVVLVVVFTAANVEAQSPYVGGYGGYLGWPRYVRDHVPYFAANPPVYYSYPVARAYGFSPYAYPPGTVTPELGPLQPALFENAFVRSMTDPNAAMPKTIENPYYQQETKPEVKAKPTPAPKPAVKPQPTPAAKPAAKPQPTPPAKPAT